MAGDMPVFIVEVYTPDEIVEARKPFSAVNPADASERVNDSETVLFGI